MKTAIKISVPLRKFLGFCERVDDYAAALDDGIEVIGFTSGSFSLIDIIDVLARRLNRPSVVLSTWTAAAAEMTHVHEFLETGVIGEARWIVDRSFQNRQPALCDSLRARFGDDAIRVQRVHCKFALLDDGERRVVVQTSANLNKNARIENVSVSPCPVFYEAYSGLVADIFGTQMPGVGFERDASVTSSFKQVVKRDRKRKTVISPWLSAPAI
jgi:hypothetical protein